MYYLPALILSLLLAILYVHGVICYAKSLQSCPTLCDPIDGSPPGSPVPGILQARTLEWVAISFSNAGKWKEKVKSLCCVWLLATPWTAAYQSPPSMGFSRQEYWSGVPLPSPWGDKSHNNSETNSFFFIRLLPQGLRWIYWLQNHVHIAFTAERDKKSRRHISFLR